MDQCVIGAQMTYTYNYCPTIDGSSIFRQNMDNALCIEFASRNATLCEEVAMVVNPDNLRNNYCPFVRSSSIPTKQAGAELCQAQGKFETVSQ